MKLFNCLGFESIPTLVGERFSIQFFPMQSAIRQMPIHQGEESIIVTPLNEMGEFVQNQVIQAKHRLLCDFELEPDARASDSDLNPSQAVRQMRERRIPEGDDDEQIVERVCRLEEVAAEHFELVKEVSQIVAEA